MVCKSYDTYDMIHIYQEQPLYLQVIVHQSITKLAKNNIIVIHRNDQAVIPLVGLDTFLYDVRAHVSIFALEQCDDLFVNVCLTFLARHVILFAKGPSSLHKIFQSLMRESDRR